MVLLAVIVAGLALLEFSLLNLLLGTGSRLSDRFVQTQASQLSPDPDIVIVDIDEYSLDGISRKEGYGRYPWPRSVQADVLAGILKQRPRAVVYDILFSDKDRDLQQQSDAYFGEVIQSADNVYFPILRLPATGDSSSEVVLGRFGSALGFTATANADPSAHVALQLPGVAAAIDTGRLGLVNFIEDPDGVGRRYLLYLDAYGWRIPSLPARLARELGYPLPDRESIRLHWRGSKLAFKRVSFYDLYDDFVNRQVPQRPADELTGKIVVIGATATSLGDIRTSPIASLHPGVEILATAIDNLKNNRYMLEPHEAFAPVLTILIILGLWYAFRNVRNSYRIFIGYLGFAVVLLVVAYLAVDARLVVPVFRPLVFGGLFYTLAALFDYLDERRTRERSMQMFGRFVDPRVVNDLVSEGEQALDRYFHSKRINVTVLFSDIRGFTTMSQHREPEEIVELLNGYFSRQTDVIFQHGGTMDKFIGDAIMAFWGAPISDPDHAQHAVEAALDMVEALMLFKQSLGGELGEHFDIGIGIHSGEAVVGMIGSQNKLDYTCIGDTVNTASRLEGQTKGRARILVSAATKALCNDTIGFIDHGAVDVKGRDEAVLIFEPYRQS